MTDAFRTATSSATQPRSPNAVAVDSLIRRSLKVADPCNPIQIANALLLRYPDEALKEQCEQAGLPYSTLAGFLPAGGTATGAPALELAQAWNDLDRDVQSLVTSSQLKNVWPELAGWGSTVRQVAANGLAAAALAIDAVAFDQAMAGRSGLYGYARLARYVGALNDGCGVYFRGFADSCDLLAALILVEIGRAFAAAGVTRSTSIVQVSAGDLRMRRNTVVTGLRNLTGAIAGTADEEQYPRGLEAYRSLVRTLDDSAQADLSALLEENALARAMDDLVDLSTGASIDSLRQLTTSASFVVQRFQQLIDFANSTDAAKAPPLARFISALTLFVDAFAASGSNRLLFIARPPIVAYGLYGAGGPDIGAQRLIDLATLRGTIAEEIDCFAGCGCDEKTLRCQIVLDYILFAIDRAIDLYAIGTNPDGKGEPEVRAAVTGTVIGKLIDLKVFGDDSIAGAPEPCPISTKLKTALTKAQTLLLEPVSPNQVPKQTLDRELRIAFQAEGQIERLVRSLSPSCQTSKLFNSKGFFPGNPAESPIRALFQQIGNVDLGAGAEMPDPAALSLDRIADKFESMQCPPPPPPPSSYSPPPSPPPPPSSYSPPPPPPPPPSSYSPPLPRGGNPPARPPVIAVQQAPAASDTAPSPRSIESAMLCMNAVTPSGKINPATPYGSVLTKCGYTSLAAIRAVGAKHDFISSVRSCLDQASSNLADAISDAGLGHFFDIAPHLEAAPTAKKTP